MVSDNKMKVNDQALHTKIEAIQAENEALRSQLEEAQEALRAISTGEVDALVVYGEQGERIYTLQGADYAYRVMVESIHEGAANIKADGTILYCNKRLAEMVKQPLEKVLGTSFYQYLLPAQNEVFESLTQKGLESFARIELSLACGEGDPLPVLITASAAEVDGRRGVCLVVTDLTEQKQAMARERELQSHLMEQREKERVRIARNLHDGPLQDLISLSYSLEEIINTAKKAEGTENLGLPDVRAGILKLAGDLRNVCNELRPISTVRFGLSKAIQYQCDEIREKNSELEINLDLPKDSQSIPKDISTVLFRIFQESMNNIIRHAEANQVMVTLIQSESSVTMAVKDNGKGFTPPNDLIEFAREGHLGLVGMHERAEALGGTVRVYSEPSKGTTVQVVVPRDVSAPNQVSL